MRATLLYQAGDVRVEDVEDPKVKQPTDAVVRIVAGSVCGSDLWPYVLSGEIHPGRVFDRTVALEDVAEGYRLMNDREALKVLVRP